MKTKIYFIESSTDFNNSNLDSPLISGSEKTLINITNELSKNTDLIIKVFNKTKESLIKDNLEWNNISQINKYDNPDFAIAMSDANLLSYLDCKKKFLWSHSVQPIEKFIRKKQFFPFLKNKPKMILEGEYHYKTRSFFTSWYGKKILPIAVDYEFINAKVDTTKINEKKAIFTTRSDRNLNFLINCWKVIIKNSKNSSLWINPPYNISEENKKNNIQLRKKGSKEDLIKDLLGSRVMLNPGHKGEVFCLAAEEARELCVPIVTMGSGSLYERVEHNKTGFIAKNKNEFINFSLNILNDEKVYSELRKNLMLRRNSRTYKNVANDFLKLIYEN